MKKLADTLPNMIVSLGVATILSGGILGVMYEVTKEPIAEQELNQQLEAIREVAPPFDNNPKEEAVTVTVNGVACTVFPARENGKETGAAVEATTMEGFGGEVTLMVGFDSEGKVTQYRVLKHSETPGLGSKMQEWFREPKGARSIIGKSPEKTKFRVTKEAGGEIDAITGATISSRAFLGAVRSAYEAYRGTEGEEDGTTGATSHSNR